MTFWLYVSTHWAVIWGFLLSEKIVIGLIITSGIKTMPVPGSSWRFWFYDWAHQFFNITNVRLSPQPVITPPQSPPVSEQKQ